MEAVKFLKERGRMCESARNCDGCRLKFYQCQRYTIVDNPEMVVHIVENWSKEHPIKTRAQKFEEVFGYKPYRQNDFEFLCSCPPTECFGLCDDCTKWWDEPYEEPKKK